MKREIEEEIEKLSASLHNYYQFRNTEAVNRLAMLSLILGAGAVITGFFGMNFGGHFEKREDLLSTRSPQHADPLDCHRRRGGVRGVRHRVRDVRGDLELERLSREPAAPLVAGEERAACAKFEARGLFPHIDPWCAKKSEDDSILLRFDLRRVDSRHLFQVLDRFELASLFTISNDSGRLRPPERESAL
jgi:hypothetical protein